MTERNDKLKTATQHIKSSQYMTLNELADWAAKNLYDVTEQTQERNYYETHDKLVVSGLVVEPRRREIFLLRKIFDDPGANWTNSGIDEKIINQIRTAKYDDDATAKEFIKNLKLFLCDPVGQPDIATKAWVDYALDSVNKIDNMLVKTHLKFAILRAPEPFTSGTKLNRQARAKLEFDLLFGYTYTDYMVIGDYYDQISCYNMSEFWNLQKIYKQYEQYMWTRILAEASQPEPDRHKIENLCNVAIVKLRGINNSGPGGGLGNDISIYSLRKIFNAQNALNFVKEHADEIKNKKELFNRILSEEQKALEYKKITDERINLQKVQQLHKNVER